MQCGVFPRKVKCARTFCSQGNQLSPTLGNPVRDQSTVLSWKSKAVAHPSLPSSDFLNISLVKMCSFRYGVGIVRFRINLGTVSGERDRSSVDHANLTPGACRLQHAALVSSTDANSCLDCSWKVIIIQHYLSLAVMTRLALLGDLGPHCHVRFRCIPHFLRTQTLFACFGNAM